MNQWGFCKERRSAFPTVYMNKHYLLIFFTLLFLSCSTTKQHGKRAWSKKPFFASLMINEVEFTLSSSDNKYSLNDPTKFELHLKNRSDSRKEFNTIDNKFLVCTIKAEHFGKAKKIIINSSDVIKKESFSIFPGEERIFDFSIEFDKEIIQNNEYLYCQMNLYFLERQFRRNSLTIYLERH